MKSSGVSRFLSRRDKHHEKRSSKTASSKVCHSPAPHQPRLGYQSHSQSLEALYHKLPPALRTSVEDGLLFFQRNTLSRASFTSAVGQVSPLSFNHVSNILHYSLVRRTPSPQTSTQSSPMKTRKPQRTRMPRRRCVGRRRHVPGLEVDLS
jgi:hypothetical protein